MIKLSLMALLASVFNNELILINPIRGNGNFNSYGNYIAQDRNILVESSFNNNNSNRNRNR